MLLAYTDIFAGSDMLDAIAPNFPRAETIEAAGKACTYTCVLYVTIEAV